MGQAAVLVVGFVGGDAVEEVGEVVAGESPLEWGGDLFVAPLEGQVGGLDFSEAVEVVGGEDLALDDGEVDLDLVEPGGVDGQLHEAGVGPAVLRVGRWRAGRGGSEPLSTTQNTRRAEA